MLPTHHALAAGLVAVPLARRGWRWRYLTLFAASAVLIDADHYLGYVLETGDLSLRRAYTFHRSKYRHPRGMPWQWRWRPSRPALGFSRHRLFHALPVLVALLVLSRRFPLLTPVAVGVLLHRLQDETWGWIYHSQHEESSHVT